MAYIRRRRFRRRPYFLRYGSGLRRWRRRSRFLRRRYRRWRPYRRVRRRRLRRRGRRGWRRRRYIRRRRFRRGRRYKLRLFQWSPKYRVTCYITGYFPVMWFTRKELYRPFLDPVSGMFLGGGLSVCYWSLDMLFNELTMGRNRWSKSNFGFPYARFKWARFWLYRRNVWSYLVSWEQGDKADDSLPWSDIHPSTILMNRKRVLMRSNALLPYERQYRPKRLFFKTPQDMTNQWYTMSSLAHKTLIRLCCNLVDMDHIWFYIDQWQDAKGYYSSHGYKTPDRRSLFKFNLVGEHGPLSLADILTQERADFSGSWEAITVQDKTNKAVQNAYQLYRPWGGIFNTLYPADKYSFMTEESQQEVLSTVNFQGSLFYSGQLQHAEESLQSIHAKIINIRRTPEIFKTARVIADAHAHTGAIRFDASGSTSTYPQSGYNLFTQRTRGRPFDYSILNAPLSQSPASHTYYKQLFWFGRYNPCWDNGNGNKVWGFWIKADKGANVSKEWELFARGWTGPPPGLEDTVEMMEVSENVPYYKEFYGHSYSTYLTWLNLKYPKIQEASYNKQGFFAVGVTMAPGYPVLDGAFPEGYAPMVYQGYNYYYYSRQHYEDYGSKHENWPKWWPVGQSHPPLTDKAEIDFKCKICCLLADGRGVCYGQGLEGTLLYVDINERLKPPARGGRLWATNATYKTNDDIAYLGKCGPFVPKAWKDDGNSNECPNIYLKYRFKFQWGGDTWPGRFAEVQEPSTFNEPGEHPLPAGFPEEHMYQPPGSPSKPRKSRKTARDPNIYVGGKVRRRKRSAGPEPTDDRGDTVLQPHEASARYYDPRTHLTREGLIKDSVFKRLTCNFLDCIDRNVPRRTKVGTPDDWLLWRACNARAVDYEPSSSSSDSDTTSSTESSTSSASTVSRGSRVRRRRRQTSPPPVAKRSRHTLCEKDTRKEVAAPGPRIPPVDATRPERRRSVDLGIFDRRHIRQQLQQLIAMQSYKKQLTNFTDIARPVPPAPTRL
ncbi:ORF1 [torque teno Delphinidae virus 51]